MADSDLEAKKLHIGRLEEVLVIPMFDIFHVQRAQLAEKTESQNELLFHFKASMAKVRTWNASTIRNFIGGLTTRFPVLGEEFEKTFQELQEVTCRVLNASSSINEYSPVVEPTHTYLHELISACADSFISHPEWFQVSQSSPEYQTVLNNMKVRMAQSAVVPNSVMAFIKTSRREEDADDATEQPNDAENSDMDIFDNGSEASEASTVKGSKSINIKSGLVREEEPQADEAPTNPAPEPPTESTGPDEGATNADVQDCASDDMAVSETSAGVGEDEEYDSSATFCCDDEYSSDLSLGSSSDGSGSSGSEDLSMDDDGSEESFCSDDGSYATGLSSVGTIGSEDDSSDDGSVDGSSGDASGDDTDDASEDGSVNCSSDDASGDDTDDASEDGSVDASEDGSDSCDSASRGADSSNSSEAATSLVWESVSDGSWYTAYGSESGSDFD